MGNQKVTIERGGFEHQERDLHSSLKTSFLHSLSNGTFSLISASVGFSPQVDVRVQTDRKYNMLPYPSIHIWQYSVENNPMYFFQLFVRGAVG
jgi:hypothetical protein